jgi:Cu-Zn family superoxide dismutase
MLIMTKLNFWLTAATMCSALAYSSASVAADAQAAMTDTDGQPLGTIDLIDAPTGTLLRIELDGLAPGPKAIHIHSVGDCTDGQAHGLLNPDGPDAGDLTNFYVHDNGYAWAEIFTPLASLDGHVGATILDDDGAALVVHTRSDDHSSQPIGGAGARVACGLIEPSQ